MFIHELIYVINEFAYTQLFVLLRKGGRQYKFYLKDPNLLIITDQIFRNKVTSKRYAKRHQ